MNWTIIGCYALLQLIAFVTMGVDKRRAKQKNRNRIAEKTLWLIAWLGGAIGMWLGMVRFKHKTRKASFRFGLPLLAIVHVILMILAYYRWGFVGSLV